MVTRVDGVEGLRLLEGQQVGTSEWLTVTQEAINEFADVTGDHNWIHVDPIRAAAEGPAGSTIAHGYLTLSLIPVLFEPMLDISGTGVQLNYGLNRVRFPAPVPVNSRIRLEATLRTVEDREGGVLLTYDFVVTIDGGAKPVCVAEALFRWYSEV